MADAHPSLELFHPLVREWFLARHGRPTGVQELVWPRVARGEHVLATAPTGSGKTLAAFLWSISELARGAWEEGAVRVLYLSPLRALNNDIRRNLLEPLRQIGELAHARGEALPDIQVMTRSGDTGAAERRRMLRRPPQILITTPESLNVLLLSRGGREVLGGVRSVILDEIHAIAADKRGTFLMSAVERLAELAGEFQRIALSATVEPLDVVARFVGGYAISDGRHVPRPVTILRSGDTRRIEVEVQAPPKAGGDEGALWSAIADELRKRIESAGSTLIFVNNRRLSERLCHLINEEAGRALAWSHHGSLARELRALVEERLKAGELAAIVATSSLELGIDIGAVDQVLLVQAPRTLNAAIQRVGRSGHSVGAISRAGFHPTHSGDLLDSAVLAPLVVRQRPQAVRPVRGPLDVLAQVILAACCERARMADDLYNLVRRCDSFAELTRGAFDSVVAMLLGRYGEARLQALRPRLRREEDGALRADESVAMLLFTSGGVIPDRGSYNIRIVGSRALLGQLDEEFVWERRVGERFRIGMQTWRIERIGHNDVEVSPAGGSGMAPFWRGEAEDRDHGLCMEIGAFLEEVDGQLDRPELLEQLQRERALSADAADALVAYLRRQRGTTASALPHRRHIVVEHTAPAGPKAAGAVQIVIHACWGGAILRPWAIALSAAYDERHGAPLETFCTDSCMLVQAPGDLSAEEILALVPPERVEELVRKRLEGTGFFAARFRENAARALLLPRQYGKRMPLWLNRLRAQKLLRQVRRLGDFPIVAETHRQCLRDHFDCAKLSELLDEVRTGKIAVSEATTPAPSPFAASLVWRSTNQFMYEPDRPIEGAGSSLSDSMLHEVLHDAALRPRIPPEVVEELLGRVQRTRPGYAPGDADELADWANQRLAIPIDEWEALLDSTARDTGVPREETERGLTGRVAQLRLPGARMDLVVAVERLPWLLRACGCGVDDCAWRSPAPSGLRETAQQWRIPAAYEDADALLVETVATILTHHGPVSLDDLHGWLGGEAQRIEEALEELVEEGRAIHDVLRDGVEIDEYCDAENLERLLRLLRRSHAPAVEARPATELPLFLAMLHGLTGRGTSLEHLQERLQRLFGCPAAAELWESAILPARMERYATSMLDTLMQGTELMWVGAGREQAFFCLRPDLELFADPPRKPSELLPGPTGRYDFHAIERHTHLPSAELTRRLWDEAWKGLITNDSMATLRKGIETGFEPADASAPSMRRRGGLRAWQSTRPLLGTWHAVTVERDEPDRLERIEADKDRVRQLLDRYGILFRDLLAREAPALRWSKVLPALRLMELAGEVLAGQFFAGIAGLQFASHEAVALLGRGLDEESVWWINAADPASLCGVGVEGLEPLPPRQGSTLLVFRGARVALVGRRQCRRIDIHLPADDPALPGCLAPLREQLERDFQRPARIEVESINDEPSPKSPYAAAFESAGFVRDYRGLTLYRTYAE